MFTELSRPAREFARSAWGQPPSAVIERGPRRCRFDEESKAARQGFLSHGRDLLDEVPSYIFSFKTARNVSTIGSRLS